MAAKPVIKDGQNWVVGVGRSIKIWDENWLPCTESSKTITPRISMGKETRVTSLIVHEQAEWDVDLVRSTFLPHEAEAILSIQVNPMNLSDSQVWANSPNDIFTVKSAYRVAVKHLANTKGCEEIPGCSDSSKMIAIWKVVWKLQCPQKVQHFLGRACKNVLPTKHCLLSRKVLKEDSCDFCGESESEGHVLWGCVIAKET